MSFKVNIITMGFLYVCVILELSSARLKVQNSARAQDSLNPKP